MPIEKISDLTPDSQNANNGTERGASLLENSIQKYGTGRSILIDKNGKIIAGNKTAEKAGEIGLEDLVVVKTDGNKLVAVQRTDLDLDNDLQARELAYADNRASELDLDWNIDQIRMDLEEGIDIGSFFNTGEIETFFKGIEKELDIEEDETQETYSESTEAPPSHVRMVQLFFDETTIDDFNNAVEKLKERFGTESNSDTVLHALLEMSGQQN